MLPIEARRLASQADLRRSAIKYLIAIFKTGLEPSAMCEIQDIMEGLIIITGALSRKALAFNIQSKIENQQSAIR